MLPLKQQNTFEVESSPKRQDLLSHMLTRKRTRSWDIQFKPPATGLAGKMNMSAILELTGLFYTISLGKKVVSCFERTLAIDEGSGSK